MFIFFRRIGSERQHPGIWLPSLSWNRRNWHFTRLTSTFLNGPLGMQWLSQVCSSPLELTAKTCKKCWMDQRKVMLDQLRWFMHRMLPEMWPIVHFHSSASSLVTKKTPPLTRPVHSLSLVHVLGCTSWRNTKATSWTAASKPWSTCSTNSSRPRPTPSQVCCLRAWSFDPW